MLASELKGLPNNWTVACLVPNARAKIYATSYGFAPGNVAIWDASSQAGVRESAETISQATASYMTARSAGLKSTTGLFSMAPANINHKSVAKLKEVTGVKVIPVRGVAKIREFIEGQGLPFVQGTYFYPVVKRELIGKDKDVMIRHNISGKLYGGPEARALVGLPDADIRVTPDFNAEFTLFVRSTSQNRNLVPGHDLLVVQ